MRKTLALILSVLMVLSIAVIGVSAAPEGTAIATLNDFKNMTSDGKYYLTADIDATGYTFEGGFSGTLDGNKHTVTVSQPLFKYLDGTVKNLCLRGAVTAAEGDVAALALVSSSGLTLENVVNCANITSTIETFTSGYDAAPTAAGLVAKVFGASTFTDCVNYGKVTGKLNASGLIGYCHNVVVTFTNCVNAGDIDTSSVKARTGGLMAVSGKQNVAYVTITFDNCKNYAEVKGGDQVGGMIGWCMGAVECKNCVNTGYILSSLNYAAGLVCRAGDDAAKKAAVVPSSSFINCVNTGKVEASAGQAGGIGAYIVTPAYYENCVNSGEIKCDFPKSATDSTPQGTAGGIMGKGAVDAGTATYNFVGCYNFGTVDAGQNGAGILGYVGNKGNKATAPYTIKNCVNAGDIYGYTNYAAGFVAYVYGDPGNNQYMVIENCVNTGKLTSNTWISEYIGYGNTDQNVLKNCIGAGEIVIPEGKTPYITIWGCSSKDCTNAPNLEGNLLLDGGKTVWFTYSTGTEANRLAFSVLTAAQVERVTSLTDAQTKPAMVTTLTKAATDAAAAATSFNTAAAAILNGQSPFPADVVPPVTGDGFVWFAAIAVVAVLGTAVIIRKRVND